MYAADEIYLRAGIEFPPLAAYEDLPQVENGVGLVPLFREEAKEVLGEAESLPGVEASTFTGESPAGELTRFVEALSENTGAAIHLHTVKNQFFGGHVSVTGLLTGQDVIAQLRGKPLGQVLLVPDVVLREGEDVFLDEVSLDDLEKELGVAVRKVESTPWGLLEGLEDLSP